MERKLIPLTLALLLGLTACSPGTGQAPPPTAAQPSPSPAVTAPAPTATPEPLVWVNQVFEKSFTADDGTPLMTAKYVLPAAQHPEADPAWAIITEYYKEEGEAYLEQAEDTAGFASGDYDIAQASHFAFSPYAEEASYQITYQTGSLVSVVRAYYSDIGAAYPTILQLSEQFDLYTGAKLTFRDFFSDPEAARERVLSTIHAAIDNVEGYRPADADQFFHEDNFYLTGEGFVFYYQSDSIAPHAVGIPEFIIPYTDLSDLSVR